MSQKQYTGPMRFAHRGVVQAAPENTMGAFQAAVERGYEGIEVDVQLSKDGEVILCHDANFTRMTMGHPTGFTNGRIREMDWQDICKVELPFANHLLPEELPPWSENEFMAILPYRVMGIEPNSDYVAALERDPRMTHLSRFVDFDEWFATVEQDVTIEIEVKASGLMPRLLEIISNSPNAHRYIVFSSSMHMMEIQQACRELGKPKGLRLGANIRVLNDQFKQMIPQMDLFEVGLNDKRFTADDVKWLNDHGVEVLSNLGDYPEWWEKMCKMNVLGFKTNYPGAFTRWWEQTH